MYWKENEGEGEEDKHLTDSFWYLFTSSDKFVFFFFLSFSGFVLKQLDT